MQMRQDMECAPSFAQRVRHCLDQWEQTLTFFCVIFAAALGTVFLIRRWQPALNVGNYVAYGTGGLALLGVVYIALALYAALYPEREGRYMLISVVASTGLYASFFPVNVVGIVLWGAALVTVGGGVIKRVRAFRRELRR